MERVDRQRRRLLGAGLGLGAAALLPQTVRADTSVKGQLVLYTSQLMRDAQQTAAAFQQIHPNIEVKWIRDGTTQLLTRLRAEFAAGDPQPDVLLIADTLAMAGLKQADCLAPYRDAPADVLPKQLRDHDGYWYGTKLITTGIAYNTAAPHAPQSWWDLADATGQIAMPSPLYSGAATVMLETFTQHPALGWKYYEALARAHAIAQGGNGGVFRKVAGGAKLYGIMIDFLAIRAEQKGSPIRFVFPEEGVSAVTEPVAILKTARNVPAARAFVDFVLSLPGQRLIAQQGMLPARSDVTPPPGFPKPNQIKLLNLNVERALRTVQSDKQRFASLFA
ncbi:ABC transporter substrate-binding protein [Acidihalobacter ferrooxydans]|uniref:ABC transporter substrate-binding protein n=1 Tax=Acidihalobacter ferrooxydans TaxID=1765967 RepID=A0A1P8UGT1_9GAMM|nr:ABC transporter substrate-binding protein [Acidihalobacter ferrooxydans]APZ43047.1 ABC transporter substrate-binding protein [Acidihalobacter ferrooxydans]